MEGDPFFFKVKGFFSDMSYEQYCVAGLKGLWNGGVRMISPHIFKGLMEVINAVRLCHHSAGSSCSCKLRLWHTVHKDNDWASDSDGHQP